MSAGSGRARADLHAHTTASDGIYPPAELVRLCAEAGLWAVAVTDHDSLEGLAEAKAAGERLGVRVFPGVELSCLETGEGGRRHDVHLLGLFLAADASAPLATIGARLEERRRERESRGREIVRRLAAAGVAVPWAEVEAEAAGGSVGRPHVARVLIRHGLAGDIDEAFGRYLSPGRAGHVEHVPLAVPDAIRWVREAGGAVVWAHPRLSELEPERAPWTALLDGIEAEHPKQDAATTLSLTAFARRRGLIATGGSDCHGTGGRERVGVCTTAAPAVNALARRAARAVLA